MPHQCLQCGHTFAEGSSALLAGCPACKGTRFFYTQKAVDKDERDRIAKKAQNDLQGAVAELLREAAPDVAKDLQERAGPDGWAKLKPKDLRKIVKEVQAKRQDPAPQVEEARQRLAAELEALAEMESHPDTVTIHEPGSYEVDVKGLLEKQPLVVQKDGNYAIHLASLFEKD